MSEYRSIYKEQSGFVYLGALIAAIIILVSSVGIYMWLIRGINITQQDMGKRSLDIRVRSLFEEARSAASTGYIKGERSYWRLGLFRKSCIIKPVPLQDVRDWNLMLTEGLSIDEEWILKENDPYDIRFLVGIDDESGKYIWDKPPKEMYVGEDNIKGWVFRSKRIADQDKIFKLNDCKAIKWTLKATGDYVIVEVLEEPVSRSVAGGVILHYTMIAG